MVTRKKKEEPVVEKVAKPAVKKPKAVKESWPKVTVGSHLTVTRYENGQTELKWDDEALRREIREVCAPKETVAVKPKRQKKTSDSQQISI